MADRSPAFPFYPRDYIADFKVARLTLEEDGAYHRVLCHMWDGAEDYCSIPKDVKLLASLWRVSDKRAKKILDGLQSPVGKLFLEEDREGATYLVSKRLREEREQQVSHRTKQSDAGKRGAARRWGSHSDPINSPMAKDSSALALALAVPKEPVLSAAGVLSAKGAAAHPLEQAFGRPLNGFEVELATAWSEEHPADVIEEACRRAVLAGAPRSNYIDAILRGWKAKNLHTLADVLRDDPRERDKRDEVARQKRREADAVPPCPTCHDMRLVPEDPTDLDSPFVPCPTCRGGTDG